MTERFATLVIHTGPATDSEQARAHKIALDFDWYHDATLIWGEGALFDEPDLMARLQRYHQETSFPVSLRIEEQIGNAFERTYQYWGPEADQKRLYDCLKRLQAEASDTLQILAQTQPPFSFFKLHSLRQHIDNELNQLRHVLEGIWLDL